jgi:hypothetical protein
MAVYNEQRTHQGRGCFGKTPRQTFFDAAAWAREKQNVAKCIKAHMRAREMQAEYFFDELALIADDGRNELRRSTRRQ